MRARLPEGLPLQRHPKPKAQGRSPCVYANRPYLVLWAASPPCPQAPEGRSALPWWAAL